MGISIYNAEVIVNCTMHIVVGVSLNSITCAMDKLTLIPIIFIKICKVEKWLPEKYRPEMVYQ